MESSSYRTISRSGPRLVLAVCCAILASGCATAPVQETAIPVHFVGCSSNVLPPAVIGTDPTVALVFFGLVVGYDVGAYATCVAGKLTQSDAVVANGVYRSGRDTFSVSLPSPPASVPKPSINIVQPTIRPSDFAMFWLMDDDVGLKSGAIAYGVGTSEETAAEQSQPLEQVAAEEMHQNALTTDRFGGNASVLLHHEPVTLDGRPAMFAVYGSTLHPEGASSQPLYLLTYFTRYQARSAAIVIFWQGDCPVCKDGREADIRNLDPGISHFVDSFHLNETAIAALKPEAQKGDGNPIETKPAPLALPSIVIPPGKALVYFYRESHFAGGGLNFHLEESGNKIGTLTNGTYLYTIVEPGTHTFMLSTWGSDDDPCQVQIKSGDTLYLEVYVSRPAAWPFHSLLLSCREIADLDALARMATLKDAN